MNILTLDASGPVCGVALMKDGVLVYEASVNVGLTHSETLMPMLDTALTTAGISVDQLDLIGCVAGPGSFTGVRIGVCAAKALAHAYNIPCAQLNALEVLAMGAYPVADTICPILDARRDQVYGAAFSFGETGELPIRLMDDVAMKLTDFLELLPKQGRLLFVGDGVKVHAEKIIQQLGNRARISASHVSGIRAGAGCALAERRPELRTDYLGLMPIYLRASQAERERAAREEAKQKEANANG